MSVTPDAKETKMPTVDQSSLNDEDKSDDVITVEASNSLTDVTSCNEQGCRVLSLTDDMNEKRSEVINITVTLSPSPNITAASLRHSADTWRTSRAMNSKLNLTAHFTNKTKSRLNVSLDSFSNTTWPVKYDITMGSSTVSMLLTFQTNCTSMNIEDRHRNDDDSEARNTATSNPGMFEELLKEAVARQLGILTNQMTMIISGAKCIDTPVVVIAVSTLGESKQLSVDDLFINKSRMVQFESDKSGELVSLVIISIELLRNDSVPIRQRNKDDFRSIVMTVQSRTINHLEELFGSASSILLIVSFAIVGFLAVGTGALSAITYAFFRQKYYRMFNVRRTFKRRYSSCQAAIGNDVKLHDVITLSAEELGRRPEEVHRARGALSVFDTRNNTASKCKPNENRSIGVKRHEHKDDVIKLWSLSRSASLSRCLETFSRLPEVSVGREDRQRQMSLSTVAASRLRSSGASDQTSRRHWKANPVFVDSERVPTRTTWTVSEFIDAGTNPTVTTPYLGPSDDGEKVNQIFTVVDL